MKPNTWKSEARIIGYSTMFLHLRPVYFRLKKSLISWQYKGWREIIKIVNRTSFFSSLDERRRIVKWIEKKLLLSPVGGRLLRLSCGGGFEWADVVMREIKKMPLSLSSFSQDTRKWWCDARLLWWQWARAICELEKSAFRAEAFGW